MDDDGAGAEAAACNGDNVGIMDGDLLLEKYRKLVELRRGMIFFSMAMVRRSDERTAKYAGAFKAAKTPAFVELSKRIVDSAIGKLRRFWANETTFSALKAVEDLTIRTWHTARIFTVTSIGDKENLMAAIIAATAALL